MILTNQDLELILECLMRYTDSLEGLENVDAYLLEQKINKFLNGPYIELKSIHGVCGND